MRPTNREMLGADPMFRAWQDSGGQPHPLPKRMNIAYGTLLGGFVIFTAGLLITGITGANWSLCVPVFAVFLVVFFLFVYFTPKNKKKNNWAKASPDVPRKRKKNN
jgi:hypothetical protein